ncbi:MULTISPECIES: hypothetical protein [Chloroflexus]|uniref:Uncharacterized protein n=1 Tax=Chloroflexus aggregans (strain MD-66 / DSM 9485) TaxID=326427 RepID=B8GD34_CHLAD|nr:MULTISPECIES: hypothetical protein [Chloroflexus]ACL25101.1 hypothetical protein Cagg_2218 [Chloroflexus aggregans DSM 9485]GIV88630.1 MAG: hypothetical protein KatS3mg055_1148 [Chloroflexus sp.]
MNASCGEYAYKPLAIVEFAHFITGERPSFAQIEPNAEQGAALRECHVVSASVAFQLSEGIAASNLAQAGWGVIVLATVDAAHPLRKIKQAVHLVNNTGALHDHEGFGA